MHICRTGRYNAYCAHTKSTHKSACYCYLVLQNWEDLLIQHNVDIVSIEYTRPQNSNWLEKVKRIFEIVKNIAYALFKYLTYQT